MKPDESTRLLSKRKPVEDGSRIPHRYIVSALVCFGILICYVFRVTLSVAVLSIEKEYHWGDDKKGLVLSSFFWGYITTQLIGGYLSIRFGGKIVLGCGVLIPSLFTCITPFTAANTSVLIACRVLTGVGEGVVFPTVYNLMGRWLPAYQKTFILAFVLAGVQLGTILGTEVSPPIIDSLGWRWVFYITGAAGIVWFILWMTFGADKPSNSFFTHSSEAKFIEENLDMNVTAHKYSVSVEDGASVQYNEEKPSTTATTTINKGDESMTSAQALLILMKHASFWVIVFCNLAVNWGFYVLLTWLPTYYESLNFSLSMASLMSVLPSVFTYAFSIMGGRIGDYLLARKVAPLFIRKTFFTLAYLSSAVALLAVSFLPLSRGAVAAVIALGVGATGLNSAGMSVVVLELAPKYASLVVGVSNTAGTVPGIVGVASTGFLLTKFHGSWAAVFAVPILCYLLAIIVFLIFAKTKRIL